MAWWVWCVAGLALAVLELATPGGFFVIFFGLGALVTGALTAATDLPPVAEWIVFPVVSVASLLVFRKPLLAKLRPHDKPAHEVDSMTGETAIASGAIAENGVGQVELRGTTWSARNAGRALAAGQRCQVERVEGLTLFVRAEGEGEP